MTVATADYLWERKGIVPFLKIDQGLAPITDGVQLMKPMEGLDSLLKNAVSHRIFGTKMRSVIRQANKAGIHRVVAQQFEFAARIAQIGMVPIIGQKWTLQRRSGAIRAILQDELLPQLARLARSSLYA